MSRGHPRSRTRSMSFTCSFWARKFCELAMALACGSLWVRNPKWNESPHLDKRGGGEHHHLRCCSTRGDNTAARSSPVFVELGRQVVERVGDIGVVGTASNGR